MEQRDIIFFDGICNLCCGFVQFILKNENKPLYYFSSLQSPFAHQFLDSTIIKANSNSVIFYTNGKVLSKSTAVIEILRNLNFWTKIAIIGIVLPKFIRDALYDFIARNRYQWFGKKNECWLPNPEWNSRFILG